MGFEEPENKTKKDTVKPNSKQDQCQPKISKARPVKCVNVSGGIRRPHKIIVAQVAAHKGNELISDTVGKNILVMVAREMQTGKNDEARFPRTEGGEISEEFEEAHKPHMEKAINAKKQHLK